MYKSDNIISILKNLHSLQSEIKIALDNDSELIDTDKINELYQKKGIIIEDFKIWKKTKVAQEFVDNNNSMWNDKIRPLLENEKTLEELLLSKVNSLASGLRDIHSRKKILTYYKEN